VEKREQKKQLEQFFREDPHYLKKYVKEHPDNKMAWYLLGRDYDAQGKRGKALYCYAQAGEIYEAYENEAVALPSEEVESIDRWGKAQRLQASQSRGRLRWLCTILVVLVLLLFTEGTSIDNVEPESALPAAAVMESDPALRVYYMTGNKSKETVSAALHEMLLKERMSGLSLLVMGRPLGKGEWVAWQPEPQLLVSMEGHEAQQRIRYYDRDSCQCEPSEGAEAAAAVIPAWQAQQEQELVVKSAVSAYLKRSGQAPNELAEVSQPYPNNLLPGVTPAMEAWYQQEKEQLLPKLANAAGSTEGTQPQASEPAKAAATEPFEEPMRIIVDKLTHRLAVVSGQVILRSYPVGLGGERTPEGTFAISEKVRNPNGKSNGEFGSRGMTLSDTLYAIHGTNKPSSIEKDQSLGCVRMLKEDVEELFDLVPLGTEVTIGKGLLPADTLRGKERFRVPPLTEESNPGKTYRWLN
jgi:lipoprotein-anchoring transpeptidase ErfK/SrfK